MALACGKAGVTTRSRRNIRVLSLQQFGNVVDEFHNRIGNGTRAAASPDLDAFAARVDRAIAEGHALHVSDLAVNGRIAMEVLRIPPGRAIGEALEILLEEVLEDPARNNEPYLRARLAELRARMSLA